MPNDCVEIERGFFRLILAKNCFVIETVGARPHKAQVFDRAMTNDELLYFLEMTE